MKTRGAVGPGWTLITPENRYPSRLPNLPGAIVTKLVTPRLRPARFGQYHLQLPAGCASSAPVAPGLETFLYVLEGTVRAGERTLRAGAFLYLPARVGFDLEAGEEPAALVWIKRPYETFGDLGPPPVHHGHRDDEPFAATVLEGFTRRELLPPGDTRFDFNVSLLRFAPGVGLPFVEIHDEEHGLYVTGGGGTYLLDREEHQVGADDFIYLAPYCPQGFEAGPDGAEYLLYKDVYRDGF